MKKNTIAFFIPLLFPSVTLSALPLDQGAEKTRCYAGVDNRHDGENCLELEWKKSNRDVNHLVEKKIALIKSNPDFMERFNSKSDEVTGNVFKKQLLKSQNIWEEYKKEFCLAVASSIGEEGFDYQPTIEQCEINMNKRRMEEINLMDE